MGNLFYFKNIERCALSGFQSKTTDFINMQICNCSLIIDHLMTLKEFGRSQWQFRLRRKSAACLLLRLWVRIPTGAWMPVCCECCVLSGRGLWDRAYHSSRGVLPAAVRRCVWSRNLVSEDFLARWGLLRQKKKKSRIMCRTWLSVASVIYWKLRYRRWCIQRRYTKWWF